jgi:calcineurin-like phosphoesterase family protein
VNQTYFTADHHWGHEGVIRMCGRPFASLAEMDEALVEHWNGVVRPRDTVYHLGDFSYRAGRERAQAIFRRLNGRKLLVMGNHDRQWTRELGWAEVLRDIAPVAVEGQRLVLSHYALRTWPGAFRGALHLFGHSHGRMPGTDRSTDVGVDTWGYVPVILDQIRERMAASPAHWNEEIGEPDGDEGGDE